MRMAGYILMAGLLAAAVPFAAADDGNDSALHIATQGNAYVLSVPLSRLEVHIPKGGLVQQKTPENGSSHSSRYFLFEDTRQGLVVSGWFEPASSYSDFDKMWENEKASWKSNGLPMPENEKPFKSAYWQGMAYDITLPKGSSNSHIRAFWVQAGTWIDLHVSMTGKASHAALHRKLMAFLKSIQVKARK